MQYLILITLSTFLLTEASPIANVDSTEPTRNMKRCPGGYTDGVRVDLGRYWFECRDGHLKPMGCINEEKSRIAIGETYDSNRNYRIQCVLNSDDTLAFSYKSCLADDSERRPGDSWDDGKYWYTCKRKGDYLHIILSGCISDGRRVDVNEKVIKNDFVYQCRKTSNGTCSMCPVACSKNGREYEIGETFQVTDYVYTCTYISGRISIKVIGCVNENRRLSDGDRYLKKDVIYECSVRGDTAELKPAGCVQHLENGSSVERLLGCYWNEGTDEFYYEMTCKYDQHTKTALKVPYRCMYKLKLGTYSIDPGCYQIANQTVISCEKDKTSGGLSMSTFRIDDIGQLTAKGLRYC